MSKLPFCNYTGNYKLFEGGLGISYEGLAAQTGKSRATISRMISHLKNKGVICREGSAKNGKWVIRKPDAIV